MPIMFRKPGNEPMKYNAKRKLAQFVVGKKITNFTNVIGVIATIILLWVFVSEITDVTRLKMSGKSVLGVTESSNNYGSRGHVKYKFMLDDKKYSGDINKYKYLSWLIFPDEFREIRKGDEVEIIYLPDNPDINRMRMTLNYSVSIWWLWCLVLFGGGTVYLLNSKKRHQKIREEYNIQNGKHIYNIKEDK